MVRIGGHKALGRHYHGCQRTFHVRRAAAIQHAVADGRLKRRVVPAFFVAGRHHVGVAGKCQGLPLATPGPKIQGIAERHRLNGEADGLKTFNHQRLTAFVVRAEGRTFDQLLGQFDYRASHAATSEINC